MRSVADVQAVVRVAARRLTGADGATFVLRDGDSCYYADEDAISPLWKGQRFPIDQLHQRLGDAQPPARRDRGHLRRRPDPACGLPADVRAGAWRWCRSAPASRSGRSAPTGPSHHLPTEQEVELLQALADSTAVAHGERSRLPGARGSPDGDAAAAGDRGRVPRRCHLRAHRAGGPHRRPGGPQARADRGGRAPDPPGGAAARHRQARASPDADPAKAGPADPDESEQIRRHPAAGRHDPGRQPVAGAAAGAGDRTQPSRVVGRQRLPAAAARARRSRSAAASSPWPTCSTRSRTSGRTSRRGPWRRRPPRSAGCRAHSSIPRYASRSRGSIRPPWSRPVAPSR